MKARRLGTAAGEPLRIVAIGGGTGLSTLLHGLKTSMHYRGTELDITAVVTVTDDGGSSGRLRRDFDVLPPGDIRNCMVAMSEDEALLSKLFQYRFSSGKGLKGHSFGNLFLTALTDLTGDFAKAVQLSSEVLASCGRIYPSTAANVSLEATLENGKKIYGETLISKSRSRIQRVAIRPAGCRPMAEAIEAIERADLITLGPGSLFTSVIPNLLVNGIADAIRKSLAARAYFVNLMWQPGETIEFSAADHVQAIYQHAGKELLDVAVVNTRPITAPLKRRYARQMAKPVQIDSDRLNALGVQVIATELAALSEKVRHDPDAIAAVALKLAGDSRQRRHRKTNEN
ncbi:MAG TPA: YvcK family protein [Bryobacteraceae bacterium]|nr:YvcK family protein [Bryobacteraceae bacterium]